MNISKPTDLGQFSAKTASGFRCNLAARTKLLPNAAVVKWSEHPTIVIGADPGEIVAVATTRLDKDSGQRHSKKIKRSFLHDPHRQFERALSKKKKDNFIDRLESLTPSRKLGGVGDFLDFMNTPAKDILLPLAQSIQDRDTINRMNGTVREQLFSFYHSSWILKKLWDCKKSQRSAVDLAVHSMLAQADLNPNWKKQESSTAVLGYGLSQFNTRRGPASMAGVIRQKSVKAVKTLFLKRLINFDASC